MAWTISTGDDYSFEIVPSGTAAYNEELLNGTFPTKRAALEAAIENMCRDRQLLSDSIALAKRRLRQML
jgi:hypothetical protein